MPSLARTRPLSFAALLLVTPPSPARAPALAVVGLRHEYRTNPLGTDARRPRLSWRIESTSRGTMQSAYQIQVSSSERALASGRQLLWDSGKRLTDASLFQEYGGPELQSRTRYHWRVRVWDGNGKASPWSAIAFWETGLLTPGDWTARWIGPATSLNDSAGAPAPMLRRGFEVEGLIRSARLYVSSLGLNEIHLNGRRVGDALFAPGWTSYGKRLQYQTYDVTTLLQPGANAIGAILGDGWYRGFLGFATRRNTYGRRVALLLQLEISYRDGRTVRITSGPEWKSSTGAIRFADIYKGETYDARLEVADWARATFDAGAWAPVVPGEPVTAALVAPVAEPVRRIQEITPVAILHSPRGETLFDLGQNMTGWVRLRVRGTRGTTITLRHAEVLDSLGNLYTANLRAADQTDRYTLRGAAEEVYEPRFTYHGFRYVSVDGLTQPPERSTITGIVVSSDLAPSGSFVTSDSMLNRLQRNIVWGQRGNFLDVPTDCPQRDERLGWTGDAQVFARTASFNADVSGFFAKWLADLAADQHPGGSVPWVIPNPLGGDSVRYAAAAGWGDAATVVPWTMYLAYGDRGLLARQFESMRQWVDYEHRRAGPSLLWNSGDHFGDWLAWHSVDASYPGATTGKDLIATAYLAHSADLVSRAATVLGRAEDAHTYRALFDSVRVAFRKEFVSPNGRVGENTQTAYALALNFGLLADTETHEAVERLVADIGRHEGHLSTGFLGTPELSHALSANGQLDAAYALLMQRTYPSWLFPITRGATTMWERWDGIGPDGAFQETSMNSFNHYAFGAIGDWMYRTIGGLDIDPAAPGYKHVMVAPRPGGGLTSATTTLSTPYGPLASRWTIDSTGFHLALTIPANTTATVTLPNPTRSAVRQGRAAVVVGDGVLSVREQGPNTRLELGSGDFMLTVARSTD